MMVIRCLNFKSKQISFHFLIYFYQEWVNWVICCTTPNTVFQMTNWFWQVFAYGWNYRKEPRTSMKEKTKKNNDKKCYSNTFRIFNAEDNTWRWMTRLFQLTQSQHVLYLHENLVIYYEKNLTFSHRNFLVDWYHNRFNELLFTFYNCDLFVDEITTTTMAVWVLIKLYRFAWINSLHLSIKWQ